MAAEYQCDDRAAEEISQLLYHLQVLMLAKGLTLDGRLPTSAARPPTPVRTTRKPIMLRIAVPNKGTLSETAAEMLREAGLRQRAATPRSCIVADAAERRRVLLPAPPRHRHLRRIRARSTSASRAATCCSTPTRRPSRSTRSTSAALDVPVRRPDRARSRRCADLAGRARRHQLRRPRRRLPRRARASTASVVRLDGRGRVRPSGSGVAGCRRRRRRDRIDAAQQGLEIFGPVILESTAVLIAAHPDVAGRRDAPPPPPGRHGRPPLRADGLRPPGRAGGRGVAGSRPGLESPTVSPLRDTGWVAVRVMVPRERHQPRDGRALRARRARDPRQLDPRRAHLMSVGVRGSSRASTSPRGRVVKGVNFLEPRGTPVTPSSSRATLLRAGRRRGHLPRRDGDRRGPGDDVRDGHRDRRAGVHPAHRRRGRALRRATSRACSPAAPTRWASTAPRSRVRSCSARSPTASARRCSCSRST